MSKKAEEVPIEKSEYPVMLDGREYSLRFNHAALEAIENMTDKPWMAIVVGGMTGKISNLRVLLQAGLMAKHPDMTREKVIALMEAKASDFLSIREEVAAAVTPAMVRIKASVESAAARNIKKKTDNSITQTGA